MDTLYHLFRSSVRWNVAGALTYQLLLIAHQTALFKIMPPATYGLVSTILSMIYLGALVVDAGFDASLSIFFGQMKKSKKEFMRLAVPHWITEGAMALIIAAVSLYISHIAIIAQKLSPLIVGSAVLMMVAEGFRRSLRMTLQLAFKAHLVTLVDVGMLVSYLLFIWTSYASGASLTLELLIPSLACASAASALVLAIIIAWWVQTLPNLSPEGAQQCITHRQLITHRLTNSGNIIAHQIFSGNILVPLVAMSSGLSDAGIVKLASYLAYGLVTLARKIFGFSGTALLSALKKSSPAEKQEAFWCLSRALYATLFFSVISLASMSSQLFAHQSAHSHYSLVLGLLVALIVSEGLYLVYETVYIVEEKALYLVTLNGAAALIAGLLFTFTAPWLTTIQLLSTILIVRLFLFGIMAIGACKLFDLYPPRPQINSDLFTRAMALAGLAYLCGAPLALLFTR